VKELENHVQRLVRNLEHVRDRWFAFKVAPELADRTWSRDVVVTLDEEKEPATSPGRFAILIKKPGSESTSPSAGESEPKLEKSDTLSGAESESTATPSEQSPTPKKKSQKDPFAGAEPESSPQ
jgi:hypothetical protein